MRTLRVPRLTRAVHRVALPQAAGVGALDVGGTTVVAHRVLFRAASDPITPPWVTRAGSVPATTLEEP